MLVNLRSALALLTVLPVAPKVDDDFAFGRTFAWFPLVGLLIGALVAAVATWLPDAMAPFCALALWVVLTGALHLDGFGDACDALLATTTPERRLEILKDPRAGVFGVVGIVLLLLGKYVTIGIVSPWALIAAPIAGRWAIVLAAWSFADARPSGMGALFRKGLGVQQVQVATVTAAVAILVLAMLDVRVLVALLVAPLVALGFGVFASRRLGGGITGDIYGAVCESVELIVLISIALIVNQPLPT